MEFSTAWGNSYKSPLTPVITFSEFHFCESSLSLTSMIGTLTLFFKALQMTNFEDIFLHNGAFMYDFYSATLPPAFPDYFTVFIKRNNCNKRLASRFSYTRPPIRTNCGKFSIEFEGAKL